MDPVAFYIFGHQPIYWYGILISFGVLIGIFLAMRNTKVFGMDPDTIVDMSLLVIPAAIIGARLYYVFSEWDQYKNSLLDIFNIRKGGLAIYGGVLAGVLAAYLFSRRKKIDFWNLADICAPSIILGQAIGRWGNFINQEAFGYVVNDPQWQWFPAAVFIKEDMQWHMATFFYESCWNLIVFFILMAYRRSRKKTGEVFLLYLILYSLGRVFIEGLRTDSLYWGSIRASQLVGVLLILFGIVMFIYRRKHVPAAGSGQGEFQVSGDGTVSVHSGAGDDGMTAGVTEEAEEDIPEAPPDDASEEDDTELPSNDATEPENADGEERPADDSPAESREPESPEPEPEKQ